MKIAIMQPYFFPYLGHFALVAQCEKWVVFDVTQYTPKTWMSRNRVLHPVRGWNYVSVPLLNSSISIKTKDAEIQSFTNLVSTLRGKLSHYRRNAPFYPAVEDLFADIFCHATKSLVSLNICALRTVCRYLEIPLNYVVASELQLNFVDVDHPGAWAPKICRALGAKQYINPIGGQTLFRLEDFEQAEINLQFLHFGAFAYPTGSYQFEENLSILDVMMWNSPKAIRDAIARLSSVTDASLSVSPLTPPP